MVTLTNQDLRFAFRRIQMVGDQNLPIKVSYAMTRTKNKYLEPEVKSFREETDGLDEDSDEFQTHLDHEVETDVHNVSAQQLDGVDLPPELFIGLTFLFPESDEISQEWHEFQNREIVQAINVLQRWSSEPMEKADSILQISHALTELRSETMFIQKKLGDLNQQIQSAEDPSELVEQRTRFLDETTEVTVSKIDVDALIQNGVEVAPNELEAADSFLE